MGIDGLLKFLQPVSHEEHLSSFRGQTAAIDMMAWIYKGCYRPNTQPDVSTTLNCVTFILEMLDLLSFYEIKPICVFDGRGLKAKALTQAKRRAARQENQRKGEESHQAGREDEAKKYLQRAITIDEPLVSSVIAVLNERKIKIFAAPYEADSQIAKLYHLGHANFAIAEDSDQVVYGVRLLAKLNNNGDCVLIDLANPLPTDSIFLKQFLSFTAEERLSVAILAGCDYSPSVKGIGIKKAIKLVGDNQTLIQSIEALKNQSKMAELVPENYEDITQHARLIFQLATVYNPESKLLEFLHPELKDQAVPLLMEDEELLQIVGPHYDYSQDVRLGKKDSRHLKERQLIVPEGLAQRVSLNTATLVAREKQFKEKETEKQNVLARMIENGESLPSWDIGKRLKDKPLVSAEEKMILRAILVRQLNELQHYEYEEDSHSRANSEREIEEMQSESSPEQSKQQPEKPNNAQ